MVKEVIITNSNINFYISLIIKMMAEKGVDELLVKVKCGGGNEKVAELILNLIDDATGIRITNKEKKNTCNSAGFIIKMIEYHLEKLGAIIK